MNNEVYADVAIVALSSYVYRMVGTSSTSEFAITGLSSNTCGSFVPGSTRNQARGYRGSMLAAMILLYRTQIYPKSQGSSSLMYTS
jgi:hypothetical protein